MQDKQDRENSPNHVHRRGRTLRVAVVASVLAGSLACVTTDANRPRSGLVDQAERSGLPPSEAFAMADALAADIAGSIETASDNIIARTTDAEIRRVAVRWKAEAVPATYKALFHSDPIVALFDGWALVLQMRDYFTGGVGRDQFGPHQQIAIDALERLEGRVRAAAARLVQDEGELEHIGQRFNEWAAQHPMGASIVTRESIAPQTAKLYPELERGAFASIGDLTQTLTILSMRLNSYAGYLPKAARWQAELLGDELFSRDETQALQRNLATMASAATQVSELAAEAPSLVGQGAERVRDDLRRERVSVTEAVQREREGFEAALARERTAVLEGVRQERMAAFEALRQERIASVEAARAAAHAIADNMLDRLDAAVTHVAWLIGALVVTALLWTTLLAWWFAQRVIWTGKRGDALFDVDCRSSRQSTDLP